MNAPDDQYAEDGDPMEHYEEYCEWLQSQAELYICNGDDLIRHFENATRYEDFLDERKHNG